MPACPRQVAKCILWETQQIAAFVKRLKAMPEGDTTCSTTPPSSSPRTVGEGRPAQSRQYGVSGRRQRGRRHRSGRHLAFTPEDPNARRPGQRRTAVDRAAAIAIPNSNRIANVHLSLLQAAGVPATSFADSTKPIPGLLNL